MIRLRRAGAPLLRGLALAWIAFALAVPCATAGTGEQTAARGASPSVVVEGNAQLFATFCALEAAGFEAEVSVTSFHPLRARIRAEMLRLQGPATQALRKYYQEHLLGDSSETLSRYLSFALVAGPPPKFDYVLRHDELPPDVLAMEAFNEVLANFYQEAGIERLWARVEPEYEREAARLHNPVGKLVMASTAYLREILRPAGRRTFAVYVEPMVGARTNFRNYGERYAVVVGPGGELPLDEIRHAFLHFLLDPLVIRYPGVVAAKRPLHEFAGRAPRLPAEYRDDFPALVTESLVRAVELRQRRLPAEKLAAARDEAEADGYILVGAFLRELAKFENAEPAMSLYFPDLMRGISLAEEGKRLQNVKFAAAGAGATRSSAKEFGRSAPAGEGAEITAWLTEGERSIAAQNAEGAAAAFQRVLAKQPDHPRALYGLAVAQVLQGEADRARELFQRLVTRPTGPEARSQRADPLILAWSHVYLGRIHDVDGNRELARSEYQAALAVEGAPEAARLAAQRGIEQGYRSGPKVP